MTCKRGEMAQDRGQSTMRSLRASPPPPTFFMSLSKTASRAQRVLFAGDRKRGFFQY